jgi:hypothetical protein
MALPTQVTHPLLSRPGTSQHKRLADFFSVQPDISLIDGRSLADILDYINKFARQVIYHEYQENDIEGEYIELGNWLAFFEKSLPFQLVRYHKTNFDQLETDILTISKNLEQNPTPEILKLLLDLCFFELILPIENLQKQANQYDFSFNSHLQGLIRSQLVPSLLSFIQLSNAANKYFCVGKHDFSSFTKSPWIIAKEDIIKIDERFKMVPGGTQGAILWLKEELNKITYQILGNARQIALDIPPFLETAVNVLKGRHEPHLGLLFAFIRLFRFFQGDLNELTQVHLEFFYEKVLKIKRKDFAADHAHLVLEVSKHLKDPYIVAKNTVFKDGKDAKNKDVLFQLDEEITIDNAKVKALKTLHLNQIDYLEDDGTSNSYIEGLYIAPVANSADGKGEQPFKDDQLKNWATLGNKPSKYIAFGKNLPEEHPLGRIGFVLASPVLWLNEGQRQITITIDCKFDSSEPIPDDLFTKVAANGQWFHLHFSGEEGWFAPKKLFKLEYPVKLPAPGTSFQLKFSGTLDSGEPKVAFYNVAKIQEAFNVDQALPMVKIELDTTKKIELSPKNTSGTERCNLLWKEGSDKKLNAALYHYLRHLKINNTTIDVTVSGVKNLLVQNEESLQDVNSPILPFGTRPKVGAEFYIGSKEVFSKNWEEAYLNVDWKNRPEKLEEHYDDYYSNEVFEDGEVKIKDNSFKVRTEILENGVWVYYEKKDKSQRALFLEQKSSIDSNVKVNENYRNTYGLYREPLEQNSILDGTHLAPLSVNSREAFLKLTLQGVSFQHERYPLVLARKLIELSGLVDPAELGKLIEIFEQFKKYITSSKLSDIVNAPVTKKDMGLEALLKLLRENIITLGEGGESIDSISELNSKISEDIEKITNTINSMIGNLAGITTAKLKLLQELLSGIAGNSSTIKNTISNGDEFPVAAREPLPDQIKEIEIILNDIEILHTAIRDQLEKEIGKHVNKKYGLPKEPYTPTIKSIWIDYKATAGQDDITLIHLYPFAKTSKVEKLQPEPNLLPHFTDEGSLFIGLEKLRPGSNLQLLFQFAEATADSESARAELSWHYLSKNTWKDLRKGFEILEDATKKMTRSGIVKLAIPEDVTNLGNTIMPPTEEGEHLFWIKVSTPSSIETVAEVVGIHTQSAIVTYLPQENSDTNRVAQPLEPEKITKSLQPDFNINKVLQPYESFGGNLPESGGQFYTRVSEHLRHKGRSIDAFDVERLILEAFPMIFKCKCISHTLGLSANIYQRDLEIAPGFVTVAVIPDLNKLKAGNSFEPKAPVSILEEIKAFLRQRMSPFARIKVMNPRFEKVDVDLKVRLIPGRDRAFYQAQLKTDLSLFLAPWYLGGSDKLSFGQPIIYSDLVGFIENLEYIDIISNLKLHDKQGVEQPQEISPETARSILTGGKIKINLDDDLCKVETKDPGGSIPSPGDIIRKPSQIPAGQARAFHKNHQPID